MEKRLNKRQRKTLAAVFAKDPNLKWREVESLLLALDAKVVQLGKGSSARIGNRVFHYHKPHGRDNVGRGLVVRVREFLQSVEVTP